MSGESRENPLRRRKKYALFLIPCILLVLFNWAINSPKEAMGQTAPPEDGSDDAVDHFLFHVSGSVEDAVKKLPASAAQNLPVPILFGVKLSEVENSWNARRSGGRLHKGTDILAPRGSLIVSPTEAVVTEIGYDRLGGNFVLTANPGGEEFYFAHLEGAAPGLEQGQVLSPGDLIGFVGNTGDARNTVTHLHFGIYYKGVAKNPYPRITKEFTTEEKAGALKKIVDGAEVPLAMAIRVVDSEHDFITQAEAERLELPEMVSYVLEHDEIIQKAHLLASNMDLNSEGEGVRLLQELLIKENAGRAARELARFGVTGHFGPLTKNALAEYQRTKGIAPASGYFGPVTQNRILDLLASDSS